MIASEAGTETVWQVALEQSKYWKSVNPKACEPRDGITFLWRSWFSTNKSLIDVDDITFSIPGAVIVACYLFFPHAPQKSWRATGSISCMPNTKCCRFRWCLLMKNVTDPKQCARTRTVNSNRVSNSHCPEATCWKMILSSCLSMNCGCIFLACGCPLRLFSGNLRAELDGKATCDVNLEHSYLVCYFVRITTARNWCYSRLISRRNSSVGSKMRAMLFWT